VPTLELMESWDSVFALPFQLSVCVQNFNMDTIYADCLLVPQGTSRWPIWQLKLVKTYQAKAALLRAAGKLILAIADTCTLSVMFLSLLVQPVGKWLALYTNTGGSQEYDKICDSSK
jgi:hypothetical protein